MSLKTFAAISVGSFELTMKIFEFSIPRLEKMAETASEGVSIFSYDKDGKGAESYSRLAKEVLNHA